MNTHRDILRIALPSILSNITVPLLGLADITITGHLGQASCIGAIAVGTTIFNLIYWIFAFLRMGTSGMTAQAYGGNDRQEIMRLLCRSLSISTVIGLLFVLLQTPLLRFALFLMSPTDAVAAGTATYFRICIWGAPAALGLYSFTGWFLGLQNARYPLYVAVTQNIINIVVSVSLVFGLHMNVEGVALGTLIAQYCGLLLSWFFCRSLVHRLSLPALPKLGEAFQGAAIRRFFRVNRDIFLRTLCLVGVTFFFTSAGSRQGEEILAANALLMQFFTFYSYFMDGFAFAGEALSGKCAGAGCKADLRNIVRGLFLWGWGVTACFTVCYLCGGTVLIGLLTNVPSVISTAHDYLPWVVFIPLAGMSAFIWDGIFIGLTATRQMLLSMACAMTVFFGTELLLFSLWQNHALWLSFLLYLATRGSLQHLMYTRIAHT